MKRKFGLVLFIIQFVVLNVASQSLPEISMETVFGKITLEIDTVNAPVSGKNFLAHIEKGTYNDAVFYRTVRMDNQPDNKIKIEVIQGGIYDEDKLKEIEPIVHETTKQTGLKHLNGTLSMARSEPGTASTEFFICIGDQPELDFGGKRNPDGQGFAAFGKVTEGMEVVKKIQQLSDFNQMLIAHLLIDIKKE